MLKFEHVTKVYGGKKALNDLSISFQSGHVYALVGPNGSGKSTMMKAAAGLVKANTGSVTYQDMPIGVESKKHISSSSPSSTREPLAIITIWSTIGSSSSNR